MFKYTFLAIFLLTAVAANSAQADLIYTLFYRNAAFGDAIDANLSATSGQVFAGTQIILRETVTGLTSSELAADNLNFYRVDVTSSGSDGSFANLSLDQTGGAPGAVNDVDTLSYLAFGPFLGQLGKTSVDLGGGQREVVLGTVDLTAPSASGSTTFSLSDYDPIIDGDFSTFSSAAGFESLAAMSGPAGGLFGSSVTFSVSAVPEPSSLILAGLVVSGCAMRQRRRRSVSVTDKSPLA